MSDTPTGRQERLDGTPSPTAERVGTGWCLRPPWGLDIDAAISREHSSSARTTCSPLAFVRVRTSSFRLLPELLPHSSRLRVLYGVSYVEVERSAIPASSCGPWLLPEVDECLGSDSK
jgi:hypothetical protein